MKNWSAVMQLLIVGFYVAFSLLIPTGIGFWLGRKLGHEVMFPLIGLGIGTIIMAYGVYQMVKPLLHQARKAEEDIKKSNNG